MLKSILKIFDIRAEETTRFSLLFIAFFLYSMGLVWGGNAIRAEVVDLNDQLGIETELLPVAQFAGGVVIIITSLFYTAYVDRLSKGRMMVVLTVIFGTAVALATIIQLLDTPASRTISYLSLYAIYQILFSVWMIHWGTYIISIYDTRSAKRVFPILTAARPLATIIAGLSYSGILKEQLALSTFDIMIIWVILLAMVAVVFYIIPFITGQRKSLLHTNRHYDITPKNLDDSARVSTFQSLREGFQFVIGNRYPRWMATGTLTFLAILTLFEYQSSIIIENQVANPDEFSRFTAELEAWSNAVALFIQLFLFNRIMRRTGLGNMNLVFPLMVLGAAGSLIFYPTILASIIALVVTGAFRRVFRKPVAALMGNALPPRSKGRARAVISGIISPMGTIVAAILLQLLPLINNDLFLSALMGGAALFYVVIAFVLRREYSRSMVDVLRNDSFSYLLAHPPDLEIDVADTRALDRLMTEMHSADDVNLKVFIASIIVQTGGRDGAVMLAKSLDNTSPELRARLLAVLLEAGIHDDRLLHIYERLVTDKHAPVRQLALRGIEEQKGRKDKNYLSIAHNRLLNDDSHAVQAEGIPALLASDNASQREAARMTYDNLRRSDDPAGRILSTQIAERTGEVTAILDLLLFQEDPDDDVRLHATRAIASLWRDDMPPKIYDKVLENIELLYSDPVERIRLVELRLLAKVTHPEVYRVLANAINDFSPRVREAAKGLLIDIGKPAIPALEAVMAQDDDYHAQRAATVLSRIDLQRYDYLLKTYSERNLHIIYRNYAWLSLLHPYVHYPGVLILETMLTNDIAIRREEVVYLVGMMTDPESLQVIEESLQSTQSRVRANATEALESITTPSIARLIAPLYDPTATFESRVTFHRPDPRAPAELLGNGYDLLLYLAQNDTTELRLFSLYALGDVALNAQTASANDSTVLPIDTQAAVNVLQASLQETDDDIRAVVKAAIRHMQGMTILQQAKKRGNHTMLSLVERIIMLRRVTMFESIPIDQLRSLADICDEEFIEKGKVIFNEGDPGGELYIVVNGSVNIGIEDAEAGVFTHFATYQAVSAFGEMTLFESDTPRSASAIADEDTLVLRLRHEPMKALLYQYPDLSLKIVHVLSDRLRQANEQISTLSSSVRQTDSID